MSAARLGRFDQTSGCALSHKCNTNDFDPPQRAVTGFD
jgi:hypothetical protein